MGVGDGLLSTGSQRRNHGLAVLHHRVSHDYVGQNHVTAVGYLDREGDHIVQLRASLVSILGDGQLGYDWDVLGDRGRNHIGVFGPGLFAAGVGLVGHSTSRIGCCCDNQLGLVARNQISNRHMNGICLSIEGVSDICTIQGYVLKLHRGI